MKIVLATEVFPPRAGGAGWSTRALALALKDAGHDVKVVTTAEGPALERDVPIVRLQGVKGPFRRGRMSRVFRAALATHAADAQVIHAQHSLSALGTLALDPHPRRIVTVRDHWPVCFWSTRMSQGKLCEGCSTGGMWLCLNGRVPVMAAPAAVPYMKWDLASKQSALRRADAVIAVSGAIASELHAAAIPNVHVIPNIVDAAEVDAAASPSPGFDLPDRFVLFVGKLEANKGARELIPALAAAGTGLPLVILGSGSEETHIRRDAEARGIEVQAPGWADRADVLRAMKRAEVLVFPSTWPEPLSRVLLEALALGVPIAAMETGGTAELIRHGESGLLADDAAGLGDAVARIVHDGVVRSRLREGASARARAFSAEALIPRYEALYRGSH